MSLFWSWLFSSWHDDDETGRLVRDAHRGVGRVHRLTARTGRAVHVDLEVVRIDLDVDLLGLGQDRDRRRARVDATLALGLGHALHAVRAALVLQPAPRVVALHEERDVAVAAVIRRLARQHLGLEAVALGEVLVHAVEVAGPEVGLLAALGALDLDDHVAALVRVAGQQQLLDPGLELGDCAPPSRRSRPAGTRASRRRSRRRAARGRRRGLAGRVPLPPRVDDGLQLGVAAAGVPGGAPVARRVDAGEVGLESIELRGELTELFEHGPQGTRPLRRAARPEAPPVRSGAVTRLALPADGTSMDVTDRAGAAARDRSPIRRRRRRRSDASASGRARRDHDPPGQLDRQRLTARSPTQFTQRRLTTAIDAAARRLYAAELRLHDGHPPAASHRRDRPSAPDRSPPRAARWSACWRRTSTTCCSSRRSPSGHWYCVIDNATDGVSYGSGHVARRGRQQRRVPTPAWPPPGQSPAVLTER